MQSPNWYLIILYQCNLNFRFNLFDPKKIRLISAIQNHIKMKTIVFGHYLIKFFVTFEFNYTSNLLFLYREINDFSILQLCGYVVTLLTRFLRNDTNL